ncbi:hypothetical protein NG819_16325 [Pseudarthrobacter sp. Fe7]|nr:hypothetical protein NG819_16325 [Pseudarthrobacter sp. Fe7]
MSDEWSHDNPAWQETLDLARKYGWSSKKNSDHGGMHLMCPGKVHEFPVYMTGRSTENVARSKRRTIRNCEHQNIAEPLDQVEIHLGKAQKLIRSAELLTDRVEAENSMEHAVQMLGLAEENLAQADEVFDAAVEKLEQAEDALSAIPPDEVTEGASKLAGEASSHVRTARLALRDLPPGNERVKALRERTESLRERVLALQARLPR